jgi:putative hemolysin
VILPALSALLGLLLSAHFSTVRTILGLLQRPGYQPPDGWARLAARTRRRLEDPTFSITVSLGRSLGTLMFVLGLWNAIFQSGQPPLWAAVLAGLASLLLLYLLGDFFPRLLARLRAERVFPFSLRFQELVSPVFFPFSAPVVRLRQLLERWLGWDGRFEFLNDEERAKVAEARSENSVDPSAVEHQIIRAALDLGETRVREILTPRLQVVAIEVDAPSSEVVEILNRSKYSRIPVYEDDLDHMVGILHAKDLFGVAESQWNLREIVRPVVHVPEAQLVSTLLRVLRSRQTHLAVVIDEHGAMSGVVTMEDALEEIVGEIRDETDDEEPLLKAIGGGEYHVAGHARIDQVQNALGRDQPSLPSLPEGVEADTVAGLFLALAGCLPEVGATLEFGRWEMTVLELDGNRISKIRLLRLPDPSAATGSEPSGEPVSATEG